MSGDALLVLDVGNTHTVLGLYAGEELVEQWRVGTRAAATGDELGALFRQLFAARGVDPGRVGAAVACCVVPPVEDALRAACERYFGASPRFVGSELDPGLSIAYPHPEEIGTDRLVNAVAVYEEFRTGCVVVDFGTATTFDVVGADGVYRGGVIAPGITLGLEALFHRAAKLPRIEIRRPDRVIGTTTVASMQSGVIYGYVGLVDGLVARILAEMPEDDVRVVATGGQAERIVQDSVHVHEVRPHLTLEGLCRIHRAGGGRVGDGEAST